MKFAIDRPSL